MKWFKKLFGGAPHNPVSDPRKPQPKQRQESAEADGHRAFERAVREAGIPDGCCIVCGGTGRCLSCSGRGRQRQDLTLDFLGVESQMPSCKTCGGAGKCKTCGGTGNVGPKAGKVIPPVTQHSHEDFSQAILALLRADKYIEAIKVWRETTGQGLKESRDAVDQIARVHNIAVKTKSGCFVATACYGSPDSSQVLALRAFRDEVLLNSHNGRRIVSAYYRLSPAIAVWLATHPGWRWFLRRFLIEPAVTLVRSCKRR